MFSAHQMGSCQMGASAKGSVVAPDGQSWQVSGLYLADASVLPTSTGAPRAAEVFSWLLHVLYGVRLGHGSNWLIGVSAQRHSALLASSVRCWLQCNERCSLQA